MTNYTRIIGINLCLAVLAAGIVVLNYNSATQTRAEETTNEVNPLRLAQLRVDFPILTLHHPGKKILEFFYPKSRNFAHQVIGVGWRYSVDGTEIRLKEIYRDLDPISHNFSDYTDYQVGGQTVKVKHSQNQRQSFLVWFHDVGVYQMEGMVDQSRLLSLFAEIGRFTAVDENEVLQRVKVLEGKTF